MKAGWEIAPLGDVCKVINGGTPKSAVASYWGGDLNWLTPKDMGKMNDRHIAETPRKITDEGLGNCSARLVPPNSVIMSTRAPIGHLAINDVPMAFNQGCRGMVPGNRLDPIYLFHFLSANREALNDLGTGATFKELSSAPLKAFPIPLPPPEEQQRIVAVLDEAFEGLARARENAEVNLKNARELFAGTISAEFSKIDSSEKRRVGDVAAHSLGKMLDKNKNKGTLRPYLRNLNVRWFTVDTSDLLEMRITDAEVERYTVRKGDLLICEGGYPGRSSIWEQDEEIFFQKALHRVRFEDEAYSRLLMYYLFMSHESGALQEHCSGAGIQHFTGKSLAKFEMPFPTLDVAKKMISTIEDMQRSSTELESHFQQKLEDLDELRQSLLQKAFAGELT